LDFTHLYIAKIYATRDVGMALQKKIENDVTWAHFCFIGEAEFS